MTEGVETREPRVAWTLSLLLLSGAGLRLIASVVAGFVEWHQGDGPFAGPGRARAYDVLSTFGAAGDGTGVLLLIAAAVAAWWATRLGDLRAPSLWPVVGWAFGLTALLAVMQGVGFGLIYTIPPGHQTARLIQTEGYALAYVVISLGGVLLLRRLGLIADERLLADDSGLDALVFAVDRATGDVRAFFSVAEATRRMHLYAVEDDEFAFYTDEGVVLEAAAEDDRIMLRQTEEVHPDELLTKLKQFINRRGIAVDPEDLDDPTAFVVPIRRWHWLEMWPPWTRPIGMLFRRNG